MSTTDWRPTAPLDTLQLRALLLKRAREYFALTGAIEIDTPILVRFPVTDVHLESLEVRRADGTRAGYLHTSPEYAMKRLLCAGAPDIFQIARVFREGERGRYHNPEFTMIEWYRRGIDHHALMDDVERLLRHMLDGIVEPGATVRQSYTAAFGATLGVDPIRGAKEELAAALTARGTDVPAGLEDDRDALLELALPLYVAPTFPADSITFVYDFPATQAALARTAGPVAARFEAFWGELELANGFHELGDAAEQRARFALDAARRTNAGRPHRPVDETFLAALRAGLPDSAGVALGFDRAVMVAAGARHIDDVLAFPIERA